MCIVLVVAIILWNVIYGGERTMRKGLRLQRVWVCGIIIIDLFRVSYRDWHLAHSASIGFIHQCVGNCGFIFWGIALIHFNVDECRFVWIFFQANTHTTIAPNLPIWKFSHTPIRKIVEFAVLRDRETEKTLPSPWHSHWPMAIVGVCVD